jgi:arsenite methyltransferase
MARTLSSVNEEIRQHECTVVLGAASWKASSMKLMNEFVSFISTEAPGLEMTLPHVISLIVDEDDEYQDLALSLEIKEIPTVLIYHQHGQKLQKFIGNEATIENVTNYLKHPNGSSSSSCAPSSSCCGPSSSCCAPSSDCCDPNTNNPDDIRKMISSQYAATLRGGASCCVSVDSTLNGYTVEDIELAGTANLGLGCGNPLSVANFQEGEIVVDLGSGAGIDCFLAAKSVGPTGQVIGIDMTPDMVYQARQNAKNFGYTNVSFRLGEIEYLPVRDSSVDVVISNCVINLSPDKQQVFHDIFRILKSNGRVAISDVVNRDIPLPESLRTAEALAC